MAVAGIVGALGIPFSGPMFARGSQENQRNDMYLKIDPDYKQESKFADKLLRIQFTPAEISDSAAPSWTAVDVIGRSEPYQIFQSTSARKIAFPLDFYAQQAVYDEVVKKVNWLRSLCYPVYEKGRTYPPPTLLLVWGELFTSLRVIVDSAAVTWKSPWEVATLLPLVATVSLSLTVVNKIPLSAEQIARQGVVSLG